MAHNDNLSLSGCPSMLGPADSLLRTLLRHIKALYHPTTPVNSIFGVGAPARAAAPWRPWRLSLRPPCCRRPLRARPPTPRMRPPPRSPLAPPRPLRRRRPQAPTPTVASGQKRALMQARRLPLQPPHPPAKPPCPVSCLCCIRFAVQTLLRQPGRCSEHPAISGCALWCCFQPCVLAQQANVLPLYQHCSALHSYPA